MRFLGLTGLVLVLVIVGLLAKKPRQDIDLAGIGIEGDESIR